MKKLFKFFCMMAAIVAGQSAWAQAGGAVVKNLDWEGTDLNSINESASPRPRFEKTNSDGFMVVNIASAGHDVRFVSDVDGAIMKSDFLSFGHTEASELNLGVISWAPKTEGYKVHVEGISTYTKIGGTKCYYMLGDTLVNSLERVSSGWAFVEDLDYSWLNQSVYNIPADTNSMAFVFVGASDRKHADAGLGAALGRLKMEYYVTPNAPEYIGGDLVLTVDSQKIHEYNLIEQVKFNPAFRSTLKFDVNVPKHMNKYLFWTSDTTFYVLKPMKVTVKAYIEKNDGEGEKHIGGYSASEVTTWTIAAKDVKIPQETPQIFYFVDDEWVRTVNDAKENTIDFYVTNPIEHFVEYVCADKSEVTYLEKTTNCLDYLESPRDRHDYFHFQKRVMGDDVIRLQIGAAGPSVLNIHAIGLELNRVPFTLDTINHDTLITFTQDAGWKNGLKVSEVGYSKTFKDTCLYFNYKYPISRWNKRIVELSFIGVPDSLFFDYAGDYDEGYHESCQLEVAYYTAESGSKYIVVDTVRDQTSDNSLRNLRYGLPETANRVRLTYRGVRHPGWVKNLKVTVKKQLDILPQDTLIDFGSDLVRVPDSVVTKKDSLSWINLFPELLYTVDAPFSADGRIPVRPDKFDTIRSHNKFNIRLHLDTIGIFTKRLKVASMDVEQPMAAYVTLKAQVNLNTKDMFARINGKLEGDSIFYGDTSVITITDSLGTVLTYDSLQLEYEYVDDSLHIKNDTVTDVCVGNHIIIVKAKANTLLPEPWQDTLYIYARENEVDSITFNFSSADEIAVHDTLTVSALDPDAKFEFWTKEADAIQQQGDSIIIGSKTFVHDSLTIYAKTLQTCEHFEHVDSITIKVRGIVNPVFNFDTTDVFGGDTLVKPFVVLDEHQLDTLTNQVTIALTFDPNEIVDSLTDGSWYINSSCEDSLSVHAIVSSDSIKTTTVDIKFPVQQYELNIQFPGTVGDRGFYFIADTLHKEDFRAIVTNEGKRKDWDITDRLDWTKEFVEAADGRVLPNGNVILDSIHVSVLNVCAAASFICDTTCANDSMLVLPARVASWRFPGTNPDSILVVGDSILVQDIEVLDSANRNLDYYVRYQFEYQPVPFAHHTNAEGYSTENDHIVLDKHGLDTIQVDTVISNIRGELVLDTTFRDRLLIAPVYPVNLQFNKKNWTVGDTISIAALKASGDLIVYSDEEKTRDVTRLSTFSLVAADSVAQFIDDSTIMLMRAGSIKLKLIAKQNGSMKSRLFTEFIQVAPVKVVEMIGIADHYTVFDVLDTKTLSFQDSLGRDLKAITKEYKVAYTVANEDTASVEGDEIHFNHVGQVTISAAVSVDATGELQQEKINIIKYEEAKVVFDETEFTVGDVVDFSRFSVVNAQDEKIDSKYYTLSYSVDPTKARINDEQTSMILDATEVVLTITLNSDDIALKDKAEFTIKANKLVADRLEFPVKADGTNYFLFEGFAIDSVRVFDANNKDITRYAQGGFTFKPTTVLNQTADSVFFKQEGYLTIKTTLSNDLITRGTHTNYVFVEQIQVDSIALPERDSYTVLDTIRASEFRAFFHDVDVTDHVSDLTISLDKTDATKLPDGSYLLIKQGKVAITSDVRGVKGSKPYTQIDTITVAPVAASYFVLTPTTFTVFDKIDINLIEFYDARDRRITDYVEPAYHSADFYHRDTENTNLMVLDLAGKHSLNVTVRGNAKGELSQEMDIAKYAGAKIQKYNEDVPVVGDVLTPQDFYLVNAEDEVITPAATKIVLSVDPDFTDNAHKDGDNIVFDQAQYVKIYADVESQAVEAEQISRFYKPVGKIAADTIIYPSYNYTVGESIEISSLRLIDSKGNDITDTYGVGAIKADRFKFFPEQTAHVENGKIYLDRSGKITVSAVVNNEFVKDTTLENILFVDHLVAESIVFPQGPFTVGDTIRSSQFQVVDAEGNDISKFADVDIYVDKAYAHFVDANVLILDKAVNDIKLYAEVKGNFGVKTIKEDTTINVAPIKVVDMEFPEPPYKVFGSVDTKDIVFLDAKGRDVTQYVTKIVAAIDKNGEVKDGKIFFTQHGPAEISIEVEAGNAETDEALIQPITIGKYDAAKVIFNGGNEFVINDVIELKDFALVDAEGKAIDPAKATFSISCVGGEQQGDNILLVKAGAQQIVATVTGEVTVATPEDAKFDITVNKAKAAYVEYPSTSYVVGTSVATADLKIRDAKNRDITSFVNNAFGVESFGFSPADAAEYDQANGRINFLKAGNVIITLAKVYNDSVEVIQDVQNTIIINQQEATSFSIIEREYQVGDTLLISDVKIFDQAGKDITESDKLFFIFDHQRAHAVDGGLVFDQVDHLDLQIAIKGYEDVARAKFDTTLNVLPRFVKEIILPINAVEVLDSLDTELIQVLDIYGHDMKNTYAKDLTISFSDSAKWAGKKIVFLQNGQVTLNISITGNAVGDSAAVITVAKNTTAWIKTPQVDFYRVGDEVKLSDFTLLDQNGNAFAANHQLSFSIDPKFGRKLDDNTIVIDTLDAQITVKAEGEVDIVDEIFDPEIKPCVVDRVVFPEGRYIVGDSIRIKDLQLLDATNRDLTRYAEYTEFKFTPATAADAASISKGYIYFLEPGVVTVATTVGVSKMAVGTLTNKIFIEQAAAASVALVNNVRTVGDTLDITEIEAYDKNGNKLTKYSDLQFVFDEDAAHFAVEGKENKIILDKAGQNTIAILVDGRKGVESKTLTPILTVNPVAVNTVEIVGDYKVTGYIDVDAVRAYAANGLDITRYVATKAYEFEAGVAHAEGEGFILDKSGVQNITVILTGADIVATPTAVSKDIAKCVAARVEFPANAIGEYRVGDVLQKSDFIVYDADGLDITKYATISFVSAPTTAAKQIAQGNIEVLETGYWTLSVVLSGHVADATFSEQYFVRHNIDKTTQYDLLVRVWEDMLAVSDVDEQFVSYIWYRDEKVIANQSTQQYYVTADDRDGKEHVYYVIAFDAQGNSYMIQEKTFVFAAQVPAKQSGASIKSATYLDAAVSYAIEASHKGAIRVSNSNGVALQHFNVESGTNSAIAPAAAGVYVLHFTTVDGQVATQKIIVK